MALSESLEDYLEAIFEIKRRKQIVRVRDVAQELGVTMPSVNGALKILEEKGYINHEKYEYIELTADGAAQASRISKRHLTIQAFLEKVLGVDRSTAETEACKIEHDISPLTMKKMADFLDKYIDTE
ncbi:metal-dependent transcriptional regulator [Candidatus Latescibacterota bacterium]